MATYSIQYFCLENPMDQGALRATVHGVTKNRTPLNTAQPCFPGVYNQREECREHISVHTESSSEDFSLVGESGTPRVLACWLGATGQSRGRSQSCHSSCRSEGHCPRSPEPTQEVSPGGALSRRPPGHPGDRGASRIS